MERSHGVAHSIRTEYIWEIKDDAMIYSGLKMSFEFWKTYGKCGK